MKNRRAFAGRRGGQSGAGLEELRDQPRFLGLFSTLVALWGLLLLAGWLPHYLTRPWYADHDHFAMLAQSWASGGKLPYRDVFSMQFPGEIYLYWVVGRVTGWGNTVAFNATDAGMVVSLCLAMIAWSLKRFRLALPGLIGSAAFLVEYLDKDYTITGQRDWHATFYALVGLIVLLGWSGRVARVASAAVYAMSVVTRPQFAVLAPAMVAAAFHQPPTDDTVARPGLRGAVEWGVVGAILLVLGFAPLFATGTFGDFLRCLRSVTYGSAYNRASPWEILLRLYAQVLSRLGGLTIPASILLLSHRLDAGTRRVAWVTLLAMAGLLLYAPISPNVFPNYQLPFDTALAFAAALLAGLILKAGENAAVQVAALLLLFGLSGLKKPEFVTSRGNYSDQFVQSLGETRVIKRKDYGALQAVGFLRSGALPAGNPPGYRDTLRHYPWDDVRGVILYLRGNTTADTPVANLALDCGTAINGVVPRLPALPADNFSLLNFPEVVLEPDLMAVKSPGSRVVVWSPKNADAEFPKYAPIWKAIRDLYRPEAKFGRLEVWRRLPEP